jgi:hypothetical protein
MGLIPLLRILTMAAAVFCLNALTVLVMRTHALGKKEYFSAARGKAAAGVVYAFGRGMLPWEKESAGKHMFTFIGGIFYHTAIFLALLYLLWIIILPVRPNPLWAFRLFLAIGAAAGFALLIKRAAKPHLRRLSCPDDFFANLFVDLFLLLALLHTFYPALEPLLLFAAILLFFYIPLGKIRHCFFFFYTRILFGVFFGRRGVFPQPPPQA